MKHAMVQCSGFISWITEALHFTYRRFTAFKISLIQSSWAIVSHAFLFGISRLNQYTQFRVNQPICVHMISTLPQHLVSFSEQELWIRTRFLFIPWSMWFSGNIMNACHLNDYSLSDFDDVIVGKITRQMLSYIRVYSYCSS